MEKVCLEERPDTPQINPLLEIRQVRTEHERDRRAHAVILREGLQQRASVFGAKAEMPRRLELPERPGRPLTEGKTRPVFLTGVMTKTIELLIRDAIGSRCAR